MRLERTVLRTAHQPAQVRCGLFPSALTDEVSHAVANQAFCRAPDAFDRESSAEDYADSTGLRTG